MRLHDASCIRHPAIRVRPMKAPRSPWKALGKRSGILGTSWESFLGSLDGRPWRSLKALGSPWKVSEVLWKSFGSPRTPLVGLGSDWKILWKSVAPLARCAGTPLETRRCWNALAKVWRALGSPWKVWEGRQKRWQTMCPRCSGSLACGRHRARGASQSTRQPQDKSKHACYGDLLIGILGTPRAIARGAVAAAALAVPAARPRRPGHAAARLPAAAGRRLSGLPGHAARRESGAPRRRRARIGCLGSNARRVRQEWS